MHRLVAERLNVKVLDRARERVGGWLVGDGPVDRRWALQWVDLLDLPVADLKEKLVEDSEGMRDLRQSTPFAGVLEEDERQKILEEIR